MKLTTFGELSKSDKQRVEKSMGLSFYDHVVGVLIKVMCGHVMFIALDKVTKAAFDEIKNW